MNRIWILVFLTLVWCGFSDDFSTLNLTIGFFAAFAAHLLVFRHKLKFKTHLPQLLVLIAYITHELVLSSLLVAKEVLQPKSSSSGCLIKFDMRLTHPSQISLLANLISLTPGTLAVDVDEHHNIMVIHLMFEKHKDKTIKFIHTILESKVLRVLDYDT